MHINIKRLWSVFLVLCLICALVPVSPVNAADDDQVKASISVTPTSIYEDEVVNVDITLEGIPYEGKVMSNDVILVIDRSGSMSSYLNDMITAAKEFVDLVDLTTHRIGIVDYASTASSYEITTNKDKLKEYLDALTSTGTTRIDLAVDKAVELLAGKRSSAEGSIVLMTDGQADDLALALQAAERAKANGYSFYTVALTSSQTSAANQNLMKMATSEADHYFVWPSSGLPDVYQKISEKIGYANAKNVVVSQVISDQFELVAGSTDTNIPQPYINGQKLRWDMNQLGKGIVHLTYQLKVKENTVPGIYNHVSSGSVVYTSYTGGSKSIVLDKVAIKVNKHAPELLSINQTDFDIVGGEQVAITGNYINDSAIVNLGSTAISNAVISNNQITFTMPAHVVGTDTITVTNPDGQVSAPLTVNFISSTPIPPMTVTPDSGLEYKSAKVTVTGITLTAKKAKQLTVTVGGTAVKVVSYDTKNKNSLAFYVPNSFGAGDVDIVITDRDGTQYTGQYTYLPKNVPDMTISSVTPVSSVEYENQKVTIAGTNFASSSKMTVTVGGTEVKLVSCSDTELSFYVPNTFAAGIYDIIITNSKLNKTATVQYEFTTEVNNTPLTVTGISPSSGEELTNQKVTVTGQNFASSSKMHVTIGGTEVKLVSCSDTELSFYVPNTFVAGVYDVVITRTDTQETQSIQYECTTVVNNTPLTVTGISPSSGEELTNQKVTVTGQNFASSSKMHVTIGGTEVKLVSCSDTELSFYVPNTFVAGVYDVVIMRTDTQETQTIQYECITVVNNTPLTVTGISPSSGEELTNQKVTVTGQNFASSSKMHVTIGGTEVKLVSCSDTELSFYVPNTFVAGVYDVVIMRTDTQETQTIQYECITVVNNTPLTVTGISPSSGEELTNQKVTVTGQNFASSSKMHVTIGGTEVKLVSCSDTELSFYVPNTLAAGTYDVVVTRTDTQESGTVQYTCTAKPVDPSPVVSSVTPTTGAENSSTKVIITGTALRGGTKSTTVTFDGQDVKLTSNTDTEVSFYTPQLVAGTYDIVITNSYGKSVTISFDIQ